ncbi:Glycine cleavage H-protein, subgroup [Syntrophomonas zehnderi OL-4]|uniref:Glycine cleavage system H protein n=1 Tax=Syntrophomonas zehnderi OL-4 TaxID=690567 RepID=A0A0E4C816_9FIRM|nr:glycine cleavage system protein GcvH [Syntrophomonas zehnderi]CFX18489.1 Glycine cleavage H-protein, subgroup [Syntrophomonas zehnderi OL-4]
MNIPQDLLYTNDHEWVRVDGEQAYVGITDFAQDNMGDIVYVEMPEIDDEIAAGDQIAVIESVKAVSSIFCPVGGTIIEINDALESAPELLNEDPYENYVAIVKMDNQDDLDQLLSPAAYEKLCAETN